MAHFFKKSLTLLGQMSFGLRSLRRFYVDVVSAENADCYFLLSPSSNVKPRTNTINPIRP